LPIELLGTGQKLLTCLIFLLAKFITYSRNIINIGNILPAGTFIGYDAGSVVGD
jgi:hypothetical protein